MALRIPRNQVQYDRNTPFYSGYDANALIRAYQQGPRRSTMDAELDPYGHIGTNWRDGGNSTPMLRDGHMMLEPGAGDTYRLTDGRQVGPETPWDYFDSTGNYLGGAFHDSGKSGIHALMPSVVKALTTAMIGGGIAGAFGMGPMASSGGFFNPGTAGAGGAGGAGGGWMSGVDGAAISGGGGAGAAAPIFSSGGAASGFAGAGGAAGAGGSGGGFMDLIKTGASKVFGGGGSGGGGMGGFDWTDLIEPAIGLAGGVYAGSQADKAADAQLTAVREGRALFEPWRQAGIYGLNKLTTMLGKDGADAAQAAFQADPGYAFRRSEGEKAMTRAAAASGLRGSGKFLKDYDRFNQDLASQEFGASVNRMLALSGLGQTATTSSADLATQGGNAQAAGIVGRANAINNGISQGLSMYGSNRLMDQLLRA